LNIFFLFSKAEMDASSVAGITFPGSGNVGELFKDLKPGGSSMFLTVV